MRFTEIGGYVKTLHVSMPKKLCAYNFANVLDIKKLHNLCASMHIFKNQTVSLKMIMPNRVRCIKIKL